MAKQTKASRRQQRQEQRQKQRRNRSIGAVVVVAMLAVVIFVTWQETNNSAALSADDVADPALGPATAPVEIVEYADLGCPACRAWHNSGIRDRILDRYGDQVRFVWKDFPVITPQSPVAAEAGHCAATQGKFWEYHDTVYERFAGLGTEALHGYASHVELDMDAFAQCLEDGRMSRKVSANEQEARQLGLRATPGFAINGSPLPAPPSYEQLASLVEQELATQQ